MERVDRLAARDVTGLTALLRRRADVLVGRAPRSLAELAQRLDSGPSVTRACLGLTAPLLQVVVTAAALGDGTSVARLAQLLDGDPVPALRELEALDLLWLDLDVVRLTPGAMDHVPDLLGLGPPFAVIAAAFPQRVLSAAERALGLPVSRSKQLAVESLGAFYADAERVRDVVAHLPDVAVDQLLAHAARGHDDGFDDAFDDGFDDGFDISRWERTAMLDRLGLDLGLLLGEAGSWGHTPTFMPAEVALALRGPGYRVRFDADPPPVAWLPVSRVESDCAAAVTAFDSAATAVLDQVASQPVPTVQAGGVGRRELQRLAKATSLDPTVVLIVLELAGRAGLLLGARPVTVTDAFAGWRDAEPPERFVLLARTWWDFPARPGEERDADGGPRRALNSVAVCNACAVARHNLVRALRADAGLSTAHIAALAGWHGPGAHAGDPPFEGHLAEAVLLGAVAQGAVTPVGAALVAGDAEALLAAATAALPASSTTAVFGSDLTVFVAGSPSAAVSTLLDSCAVRESGGGAVTWRVSSASVRRALDAGTDLADLRAALRNIADRGVLPGALEVLLDDVGRVWGRARVRDAAGIVVSDDEALLAQMLHDRKLAALGLTAVAPTVLVATADAAATTAALRKAGYMPAWDGGPVASAPVVRPFRSRPAAPPVTADPVEVAEHLLGAGPLPRELTPTEESVRGANDQLTDDEVAVLAAALDDGARVQIVYENQNGGISERVIRPTDAFGDRIWAWCELRRDDREFVVGRVLGVRAV